MERLVAKETAQVECKLGHKTARERYVIIMV